MENNNVSQDEINKFSAQAHSWWDPAGPMKTLHHINETRVKFISQNTTVSGSTILDVGCGGGLLTEALAQSHAHVTGIDLSADLIAIAKHHADESTLSIDYRCVDSESHCQQYQKTYDLVTCMELLEHVPDPLALIQDCAKACKPNGALFFSTINRSVKAFLLAIVGAEHIFNLLPKGTHVYRSFIKPGELTTWCRSAGLKPILLTGIQYHPFSQQANLCKNTDINYCLYCIKPAN